MNEEPNRRERNFEKEWTNGVKDKDKFIEDLIETIERKNHNIDWALKKWQESVMKSASYEVVFEYLVKTKLIEKKELQGAIKRSLNS